jgi:hypothetical protein
MDPRLLKRIGVTLALCLGASGFGRVAVATTDPAPAATGSRAAAPVRTVIPPATGAVGTRSISIVGVAWSADSSPLPGARVRLRNVVTGRIASTAVANETGRFTFAGVENGSYVVELVTENGKILAIGHTFTVEAGETVATFVRLGTKAPWFEGFFGNAASAVASTAASAGVTAIAPEAKPCSSPSPGCS